MARTHVHDEHATARLVDYDRWLLTGNTVWQVHGPMVKAGWDLLGGYPEFDFHLHMQISRAAPAAYSISLRVEDDQPAAWICVRGIHADDGAQQHRGFTHLHDVRHGARQKRTLEPPDPPFWRARDSDQVTPGEYRENLSAFCRYLGIDVRSFRWEHPTVDGNPVVPRWEV